MLPIERFFKDEETHLTTYFDRVDALGGQFYVRVRYDHGEAILSLGDENEGEIDIKIVTKDSEISDFIKAVWR